MHGESTAFGRSAGRWRAAAAASLQWHAGVDGCRGGWVVALAGLQSGRPAQVNLHLCKTFSAVLALCPEPVQVAVDMPIGLLERASPGGRECDRAARALLGHPFSSSVFSPPARPALANEGYGDAMRRNGAGMSKQAYNILPRIREVDEVMTPALQARVFETHPELVFARLAGQPMRHSKRTMTGRGERMRVLRALWGSLMPDPGRVRALLGRAQVAHDDVLDACVLAYAAVCIAAGKASRVPEVPPRDARGLRMEIWY